MRSKYLVNEESGEKENPRPFFAGLTTRKLITAAVILIVIIIVILLALSLFSQKNNPLFHTPNGEKIEAKVTISKDGKLVDFFKQDGNTLHFSGNPAERLDSSVKTGLASKNKRTTTLIVKDSDGKIILTNSNPNEVSIDENGEIHFSINPVQDLDLGGYFDENTQSFVFPEGESLDLSFEFVIRDEDTGETTIIEIPVQYIFQEFQETGCLALSRTAVREATHYGSLEMDVKIRVLCDSYGDLLSNIAWENDRMGNVEVQLNNYKNIAVLDKTDKLVLSAPSPGEYSAKIIFTPFSEFAGEKASYLMNFSLGSSKAKIDFDVMLDNLEQCINVSPEKIVINPDQDSASFKVDVSSCFSKTVEVSLCDKDPGCAGGTEGSVDVSNSGFVLSPKGNSSKVITVSRGEIPGAYGVTVSARAPGIEKTFVDEKLVLVEPKSDAIIVPDKFVVSLIGGARDSIRVRNKTLAEDVPIQASVCSLYRSSLGINSTSGGASLPSYGSLGRPSWWSDLLSNPERYSGSGKYQASVANTLGTLDNIRAATQSVSMQKNSLIKQAFLDSSGLNAKLQAAATSSSTAINRANTLNDSVGEANQYDGTNMASQIASLTTSLAGLAIDARTFSTKLNTTSADIQQAQISLPMSCPATSTGINSAGNAMRTATSSSPLYYQEILQALTTINQMYSIYNSINQFANQTEKVDGASAVKNAQSAQQKIAQAKQSTNKAEYYLRLAMQSASIDSFTKASTQDASASKYLDLAKDEISNAKSKLEESIITQLAANDAITTALADAPNNTELTIQMISLCYSLLQTIGLSQGKLSLIRTSLQTASMGLTAASAAASGSCSEVESCCSVPGTIAPMQESVSDLQFMSGSQIAAHIKHLGEINTIYQSFQMYQSLTSTYGADLSNTSTAFTNLINSMYTCQDGVITAVANLPNAITAANWLSAQEQNSSAASSFDNESIVSLNGNFNKKRLIGLVGAAVVNGFVNGAYEGGVYTTRNTFATSSASPLRGNSAVDTSSGSGASSGSDSSDSSDASTAPLNNNTNVSLNQKNIFFKDTHNTNHSQNQKNIFFEDTYNANHSQNQKNQPQNQKNISFDDTHNTNQSPNQKNIFFEDTHNTNQPPNQKNIFFDDTHNTNQSPNQKNIFFKDTHNTNQPQNQKNQPLNQKNISFEGTDDSSGYNPSDVELKEDCANIVSLTLPDYVIDLVHDGKEINVSNNSVIAQWMFGDAKVLDVWDSQEVGVLFANGGLKNNSYGVVEFNVIKHSHADPTITTDRFGPFNVPDSSTEALTVKYHFKFNATPQKGNNYVAFSGNECVNGLLRGNFGKSAEPKIVLSWDWNSVKGIGKIAGSGSSYRDISSAVVGNGASDEPFLDAAQLSILMSKKIGTLNNFLDSVSASCPENPAQLVLNNIRPTIMNPGTGLPYTGESTDAANFCYLPLTTREYDGKPALYYFVENKPLSEWEQWFSDIERLNDAEELLGLLEFNVNLIRDGYGTDMQYDFVNDYSNAILRAGPSFLDPSTGARKYLQDKDRAYFSSAANLLQSKDKWVLPDAGKYKVKMIVDFDSSLAKLFNGASPVAKIIFQLDLVEPVNNSYSPFYYTPFDGFVGLNASNNRRAYGSALSNNSEPFTVSKTKGALIDYSQKNALVKLNYSQIRNIFLLNSLPSLRSKILDYSYSYNASTLRDDNSQLIFSPTTATPLLFEIRGTQGEANDFFYGVKKNRQEASSTAQNLFLVSGIEDCSDLAGKPIAELYYKSPDAKAGKYYGITLPPAESTGKTFFKTVAYSPIDESYNLAKPLIGTIYSPNDSKGLNDPVALAGIGGMNVNDLSAHSVPSDLFAVLKGVENKSVCVSSLGSREIFWWPEEKIYNTPGPELESISQKELEAKQTCVK
jgi:hypothetical protein